MEYRLMERLEERPSLLGFGCMRLPTVPDSNGVVDEAKTKEMIGRAINAGVTYFDTAYPYHSGQSEKVLGRVMKNWDRKQYLLATKLPLWLIKSRDDVERVFAEQLERLQTDYVDFYLFHGIGKDRWQLMKDLELIPLLEQYQKQRKIRHLGFSFHDDYEVFEEVMNARQWDFCQIQLNYMDENFQAGLKGCRLAEKLGVPIIVMEPVKGGSLATLPEDVAAYFRQQDPSKSIASWAVRWAAGAPAVKVVLSGMSNMEQVEDNIKTFDSFHPLNEQEQKTVAKVVEAIRARVKNGCTGCQYCMPCPFGVDIPRNFAVWNEHAMYQNDRHARYMYQTVLTEEQRADHCQKCGACETKCPQKISIRADLQRLDQDLKKL